MDSQLLEAQNQSDASLQLIYSENHVLCRLFSLWKGDDRSSPLNITSLPPNHRYLSPPDGVFAREREDLQVALAQCAGRRLAQLLPQSEEEAPRDLDEEVFLYLSRDETAAWLVLFPPSGQGHAISAAQLQQLLAEKGIVYGTDKMLVRLLPIMPKRYFYLFPIAAGSLAVDGKDGSVTDHYPRTQPQAIQVDELDHADYTQLRLAQNIAQGAVICDIIPAIPGQNGHTVTGHVLTAKDGVQPAIPSGRNTQLSADGSALVASIKGHLEFSGAAFMVKPVLHIDENADRSVGNINFLGDVHIHGDVCDQITVRAMGNIQVDGVIEGCTVEAGENLIVSSGIQGQGCAVIRAHKNIYAKYIEHGCVFARESVQADCIIDSNVYSDGPVKARTGRGIILGGTIRAAQGVFAKTVGSIAEKPTTIVLGGLPCEEAERAQILTEIDRTEAEIESLSIQAMTREETQKLSRLRLNQCVAQMKLEKFDRELERHQAPDLRNDSRRLSCDIVYPGTTVMIERHTFRIQSTTESCTVGMYCGRISFL